MTASNQQVQALLQCQPLLPGRPNKPKFCRASIYMRAIVGFQVASVELVSHEMHVFASICASQVMASNNIKRARMPIILGFRYIWV